MARVESSDMLLTADQIDYNRDTGDADARGNVKYTNYVTGEKLACDRAEYNVDGETGKFYDVTGTAQPRIEARPGLLTTTNPFYFQGAWAERVEDHYILHNGFLTDCLIPRPWWRLKAARFDVIPGDHAITRNAWFYVGRMPLFYTPYFYKSLKKEARHSGMLIPTFGNSSLRGVMVGGGYYWAINRSYDLTYRPEYFSNVGSGHNVDFRGVVRQGTDFNFSLYGVEDHSTNPAISQGGVQISLQGHSILGKGWESRGALDYLSSLAFRQEFAQSFNGAIFSETHSVGVLTRHGNDTSLNIVAQRNVNFQSTQPDDEIVIRKLPEVQFITREHAIRNWPLWFSLDSSDGLERRNQPAFQTRQFVERGDFSPRLTAAFHWWGIHVVPSFGIHETFYDSSFQNGQVTGQNLLRSARDMNVDIVLPSLERVFNAPAWMGSKVKHVIEPRITYRYVTGIDNFNDIVRFDDTELLSDTNQVQFSLTNRLLAKDKNGTVTDLLSWQLAYDRYFDPTFGGAVVPGQRNVVQSVAELTGYSFLDGYRDQSPIASVFHFQSRVGLEWRTDYDPVRHGIVNNSLSVDGRIKNYLISVGHSMVREDPVLAPSANQFRGLITYGNANKRGLSYGFSAYYDYRKGYMQYSQTQVTYNTDCCGISVQYQRFSIGTRNENQFRVSFAVSNIGAFGTLKRQERIF
jgi:LPS-assembly protein